MPFRAAPKVRTPHELIRHMDDVLGYSGTSFVGGSYRAPVFSDFQTAILRFHQTLADVARHIELGTELRDATAEVLLQGPFPDAMTHAGQLALLRRLAGNPVPPEDSPSLRSPGQISARASRSPHALIKCGWRSLDACPRWNAALFGV